MNPLLDSVIKIEAFERLGDCAGRNSTFALTGAPRLARLMAAAVIARERPVIYVAESGAAALKARDDLAALTGEKAFVFPEREIQLHAFHAQSEEARMRRIRALHAAQSGETRVLVTTIEALMQRMGKPGVFKQASISVELGQTLVPQDLIRSLVMAGYERVPQVEGAGQCALRGGIADVYAANGQAFRIEFFGDEVDSVRLLDPQTQRSLENARIARIPPAVEAPLLSAAEFERCAEKLMAYGGAFEELAEALKKRFLYAGIENYLPLFSEKEYYLPDYLPGAFVALDEPNSLLERARGVYTLFRQDFEDRLLEGVALPEQARLLFEPGELEDRLREERLALLMALPRSGPIAPRETIAIHAREAAPYHGNMKLLAEDINAAKRRGVRTLLLAGARALRLQAALADEGLEIATAPALAREILPGEALILQGGLSEGVEFHESGLSVLAEAEIFGQAKSAPPKKAKSAGPRLNLFTDLAPGDFVVHESHGIGKFLRVEKLTVEDITKDYLCIAYASGDKLFIPADQMDRVQKYIGAGEDHAPKLSKLGGVEWNRSVARARASVKELAFDLAKLYAARQSERKRPFGPDTPWQQQFEDQFPYEETPDQIRSIEDIKRDLEGVKIMDRLLCGDVGYGKTEVALRAIFKTVMEGKQAAILAPTTILAHQHFQTMTQRFEGYPVTVGMLSRFRTAKEQRETLGQLAQGRVDVVAGTHRLLGKDVAYRDLGLLVVDEEHRFGVGHKEVIKNMKHHVNVLTLSATPIPRTLHMSLSGIRDMSVIETPPEERYPVKTYVMEYSDLLAREVILKELARGGQCYFVYNNVRNMDFFANKLKELAPSARIAAAHGQMNEGALEKTMLAFLAGEYDVLLCSTIVESGLDIPNVNTIIVYDSDHLGLAQLYQLRGRVGRSNKLGYAYLTFRRDKVLSEIAQKRLMAIREFTEFGAGFKIAMRDLEIRGAGNILGAQQHGHITDIGYDLYCKLMEETMGEIKGEERQADIETQVDIPISAHLPYDYIEDEGARIEMYKRIALISSREELLDVQQELIDRFGDPPKEAQSLMEVALYKSYASASMASALVVREGEFTLRFHESARMDPGKLMKLMNESEGAKLTASVPASIVYKRAGADVKQMLAHYEAFVQNLMDCIT